MSPSHTPAELADIAWDLIDEALTRGTMTLEGIPDKPIALQTASIVEIAKWLATSKAKKPRLVGSPEDFALKSTTGEGEEDVESSTDFEQE